MLKVKVGQKFKSKKSGQTIRVLASVGNDKAAVVNLKGNGHRDMISHRVVFVDSIRRKYQTV
jgi:hypothetical protein